MKQQLIISGLGGQGALTVTRLLAEAAQAAGLEVITSETHGMAQRGGTVISMIKVGPFKGPLIPAGAADAGMFLHEKNLPVHRYLMKPGGAVFVNAATPGDYLNVPAHSLAAQLGAPVVANLILLGYAVAKGGLFCDVASMARVIADNIPARFLELNLKAFRVGVDAAGAGGEAPR